MTIKFETLDVTENKIDDHFDDLEYLIAHEQHGQWILDCMEFDFEGED